MERILCIVGSMNAGGAETFLMKIHRNIDKEKYQMDYCVSERSPGIYDKEIKELGGKLYYTTPKSKGILKSFITIRKIVKDNQFKYVMRVSQHSLSALELLAAKMGGAKVVIFRSSNSQTGGNRFNRILHKLFKPLAMLIPDIKIAPSSEAAKFMFGKKSVKNNKVTLLHNALDTDKYRFNEIYRMQFRKEFNIDNKLVVGHVGRLTNQKNHTFLIEVFSNILKMNKDAILILIGKGELEDLIRNKIKEYGIEENVLMLGVRPDVNEILSAFDLFIFPSFFEGMPNTVIEAQGAGLPCVISNTITSEVVISDLVLMIDLKCSSEYWANSSLTLYKNSINNNRYCYQQCLEDKGYDIQTVVSEFIDLIFFSEKVR